MEGPRTHCYCSQDCHQHGDCCSDIDAIGCREEGIHVQPFPSGYQHADLPENLGLGLVTEV